MHIKVPDDVYAEIAAYAASDNRRVSNLFLHAVKAHMSRRPRGRTGARDTQEAADHGEGGLPVQAEGSQGTSGATP